MNHSRISPEDPKLTAYALNELPPEERAAFEAALRDDAPARAAVAEIRALAGQLEAALANEAARDSAALDAEQQTEGSSRQTPARPFLWRAALRRRRSAALTEQRPPTDIPPRKILRFPQVAWVGGTLAAACLAVVIALHQRVGRTVPGEPQVGEDVRGGGTPPTTTDGGIGRSRPTSQAQDMRGEGTPPTSKAAGSGVAGVGDPGRPGSASPATTGEVAAPLSFAADNSAGLKTTVGSPLLEQVKPAPRLDLSRAAAPQFAYNGGALAVETPAPATAGSIASSQAAAGLGRRSAEQPDRRVGFVSLSAMSGSAGGASARHTWASVASQGVTLRDADSRPSAARSFAGQRATAAEAPTYYYPPDDRFVVPVEPRVARPFVVPAPPPPLNGETWETVPKPEPPWGAAKGPLSFGYVAPAPAPFAFQLPYDWDNTIRNRPFLPHRPDPFAPPGPFDLLPGRRLEIRRFPLIRGQTQGADIESYAYQHDNRFVAPADAPFSTFSVDVDTASYANVRRFIEGGRLPPPDAVRIEELLNYFPYHYPAPAAAAPRNAAPFAASLEVAGAPWAPTHRLVRIGLKARSVVAANRPAANLVFLLDVSGSMADRNKLPLVKDAMRLLLQSLRPDDRVAIVTYAGTSGLALPSTPVSHAGEILDALDALSASGSTNGGMGIQLAYDIAKANFVKGGTNRVILCTDGDFNVGVTTQGDLVRLIEDKARSGVMLTVLGFGMGNYKDSTLELLADKGNGNYGYIDSRSEAAKLLRDEVDGTLNTVAKDVKVQVDFNPARVARYRLIGYEDRVLNAQDFNDDTVDAGEVGAGHTVTALYEIVPAATEPNRAASVDASRYVPAAPAATPAGPHASELLTVKVRYKQPDGDVSQKLEFPLVDGGGNFANASADFKFAAAVAEFGMILRHSPYLGAATMGGVIASAAAGSAKPDEDPQGHRKEFVELALKAERLIAHARGQGAETRDQEP